MIRLLLLFFILVVPYIFSFGQTRSAELVNQETKIEVRNDQLYQTNIYRIKIYNREGEKYTHVAVPGPGTVRGAKIDAYIEDKDGKIVKKLRKDDITKRSSISSFSFYEDNYVSEFTLKHHVYPYYFVYSYVGQENQFFYLDDWIPVLDENVPTLSASLTIEVPHGYRINYNQRHVGECIVDSLEKIKRYKWTASYAGMVRREKFSPRISEYFPQVIVVPENFYYGTQGSMGSWESFGDWVYGLKEGLLDLPVQEQARIAQIVEGTDDKKEKIRALFHYLQDETRYINVSIDIGGLKPYPASYVAKNKYGDCKALSNYFMAVLAHVGIPSYYSIIYADEAVKPLDMELPSQQFNHVILNVPLDEGTLWVDCTSSLAFDYVGTFIQDRNALVIDKGNSRFIKTPTLTKEDVLETRSAMFEPFKPVVFRNTYKGDKYEQLFYLSQQYNEEKKSQIIRNWFVEKNLSVIGFELEKPIRDDKQIILSYTASSDLTYNYYGNDAVVKVLPFHLPNMEVPNKRKLPVQLDYPIYMVDTLKYYIPDGYTLSSGLKDEFISGHFGEYSLNMNRQENHILVVKKILLQPGRYSLQEYEAFYHFLVQVSEFEKRNNIVFTK